jgi:hypothetical protein
VRVLRPTYEGDCLHDNTLMMEALSTSETWVSFYQTTQRIIPEDSHLQNRKIHNLRNVCYDLALNIVSSHLVLTNLKIKITLTINVPLLYKV